MQQSGEAPSRVGSFALIGGAVALDFANTSSGRGGSMRLEHLRVSGHVVDWAEHAGVIDLPTAKRMRARLSANDPGFATFLEDALSLREAIHRVAATLAVTARPLEDVAFIKSWCVRAIAAADLAPGSGGDGFIWSWPTDPPIPETVLGPIVLSAVGIMRDADLSRVKQCGGEHCGWVFFDLTKNRSRRWCEMSACGNRAKARRFRATKAGE